MANAQVNPERPDYLRFVINDQDRSHETQSATRRCNTAESGRRGAVNGWIVTAP